MKKTTYIIIGLLALLLIIETAFMFALMKTGRSKSDIPEYDRYNPYRRVDKLEINVGDVYQSVAMMKNRPDSLSLSTDTIYQPDTLIIIGKDINLFIYN